MSGRTTIEGQGVVVSNRLGNYRNEQLKDICRNYKEPVSGTKIVLQNRCKEVLDGILARKSVSQFEQFKQIAKVNDLPALGSGLNTSPSKSNSSPAFQQQGMPLNRGAGGGFGGNKMPPDGKYFKSSPFYDIVQSLLPLQDLPDGPEMPQNRHTVRANLSIKPEIAAQMRAPEGSNLKIFLYCGLAHSMTAYSLVDVTFPNQIDAKINDTDLKHNFKGLKNKPGTTKPADITGFLKKFGGQDNTISITYALTSKRFSYAVYLVRTNSADKLVERIRKGNIISREKVLRDMNKANADPDIAATSTRMSLKDPVSTMRISLPVRSSHCSHNQCFDGAMFLQLQEQAPQWSCPVCSKTVAFDSLCVDKYFEDILNRTSKAIEKVDIEPTGDWRVIKEDDNAQTNGTSGKARAAYDDDFDDLVELEQPASKAVELTAPPALNGFTPDASTPAFSPMPNGSGFPFNTPPMTTREPSVTQSVTSPATPATHTSTSNKRPASAVIDLTLSDEEDEPPRPAKRQTTMAAPRQSSIASNSNSHNVTGALPEIPRYASASTTRTNSFNRSFQADSYRPGSSHGMNNNANSDVNGIYSNYANNDVNGINTASSNINGISATTNSFQPFANHAPTPVSPANPGSPFAMPTWPTSYTRPPSLQQQHSRDMYQSAGSPFAAQASPARNSAFGIPGGGQMGSSDINRNGLRLPPLQNQQQQPPTNSPDLGNAYQPWRNDYDFSNYSSSPGG